MIVFAQEKTFQLLYDYHQKGELAAEVKKRNPAHMNEMDEEALNKNFLSRIIGYKQLFFSEDFTTGE